jgi:hypothetical protein
MKVEVTKGEFEDFYGAVEHIRNHNYDMDENRGVNGKFVYAMGVNFRKLRDDKESLDDQLKPYNEARKAKLEELADKDDKGRPKMRTISYPDGRSIQKYVCADERGMNDAVNDLRKEYKVDDIMKEKIEIEVFQVAAEEVPASIPTGVQTRLFPMLREPVADEDEKD